jgi:hypothetical protein
MTTERRINLRFTPEHFDKIDEKRFRQRLSFQDLGMRLLDNWLASEGDLAMYSSLRKPADPLVEKLAVLQARGDKGLMALPQKAIDLAYSILQQSVSAEELEHLKAVAYGEAKPLPKPEADQAPKRRGRPRKIA